MCAAAILALVQARKFWCVCSVPRRNYVLQRSTTRPEKPHAFRGPPRPPPSLTLTLTLMTTTKEWVVVVDVELKLNFTPAGSLQRVDISTGGLVQEDTNMQTCVFS